MSRSIHGTIGAALLCCVALSVQSQNQPTGTPQSVAKSLGLIIYPAKGQDATRQSTDEQQCYDRAKTQAAETERQTTFKKAMGTCLTGRGYTTG
jgi:hypothetical protein